MSELSPHEINRDSHLKKALFLDRDGVINEALICDGKPMSPRSFAEFKLVPAIKDIVAVAKAKGYLVFVVTNQPDIARGKLELTELKKMLSKVEQELDPNEISYCPHDDEDACHCRKPKPGMLLDLAKKWQVDLSRSYFLGDTWKDVEAAGATKCQSILLRTNYNQAVIADHYIDSLQELKSFL